MRLQDPVKDDSKLEICQLLLTNGAKLNTDFWNGLLLESNNSDKKLEESNWFFRKLTKKVNTQIEKDLTTAIENFIQTTETLSKNNYLTISFLLKLAEEKLWIKKSEINQIKKMDKYNKADKQYTKNNSTTFDIY